MMADHSSLPLYDIWQDQINDRSLYWKEFFKVQSQGFDALTHWHSFIDQSYSEWLNVWQQWQTALGQWLANWSDISGYTLQSNPPIGMFFPPLEDLSRLNQAVIQLIEHSTDSMFTGLGVLAPRWAAELTTQVTQLETAITGIQQHLEATTARLHTLETTDTQSNLATEITQLRNVMVDVTQHLETITARLDTSDTFVTEQVNTLRDQIQTSHDTTTQQLTALTQRLEEAPPRATRPSTRPTTRRNPQSSSDSNAP